MLRLIFLRHGLTLDNEKMRLSGFIDSKLSDIGKEQVQKTTDRLRNESIDYIYSSPLSRAVDTVKDIAQINNLDIKICEEFREMNFGDFDGLTFKEIQENHNDEFEKLSKESFEYKFPNGENMIEFHNRIANKLDEIIKSNKDNTILIASHSGVIRSCISHILFKNHEYHWNFKIDNCSISMIEIMDNFPVVHTLNNTEHLR